MPTIQAIGTAFTAMKVAVNTKTKQQLEDEESIGQTSDTSKSLNSQKTNDTKNTNNNEQTILFADPTNGNLVKLNLSTKNIEKLKSHFSNEDFYERKDGSLRLNGEAEAYVSGWFGDIAYKREFLKADTDKDGKLSDEEYQNTRNAFNGRGEDLLLFSKGRISILESKESVDEKGIYAKVQDESKRDGMVRYNDGYKADSIERELDTTIKIDKNFNSEVELSEAYRASEKNKNLSTEDIVVKHINAFYGVNATKASALATQPNNMFQSLFDFISKISKKMKFTRDELSSEEAQKAFQKLMASNGDESVLTAEEKEALGAELKAIRKRLETKDNLQEVKEEVAKKITETRFLDSIG